MKGKSFLAEVAATPGGENILSCIQCGVCAGGCPVGEEMEFAPRRMIAMIRAGEREEVLSSSSIWRCVSCYTCTARCPRGVKPTELGYALKFLANKRGVAIKGTRTPVMFHSFINSIKAAGRVNEVAMMLSFFLKTNPLNGLKIGMVGLQLMLHKRLPKTPISKQTKGGKDLARIIQKFSEIRSRY
jgi:heterodisulfide reductase subunit C